MGECSISFLGRGLDDVNVFQNTWDRHLKSVRFIACKLLPDERNMKRPQHCAFLQILSPNGSSPNLVFTVYPGHPGFPCPQSCSQKPLIRRKLSLMHGQCTMALGPNPLTLIFANTIVLEHSHACSFMCPLWLLSWHSDRAELLQQRLLVHRPEILTVCPFAEKVCGNLV